MQSVQKNAKKNKNSLGLGI